VPYKVVGGVRFYERREVRDAIAYLRAIANRADDVSLRRILNVPKRGIGDRAEGAVADLAAREGISFGDALRRVGEIPRLASRSANQLKAFARLLDEHEAMVAAEMPADSILTSVLNKSGYLAQLHESDDPQDETRLENLKELITVAREFVSGVATLSVPDDELAELAQADVAETQADPEDDLATVLDPEADLAAGAAEPDASLGAFLERVALVADSDQIPDDPDSEHAGVVTLMTLHTAKGLEFDTVFLTGFEEGVFPHQRALDERSGGELAEERRLAYVGITRARKRLYVSRAIARSSWGSPQHNPPSRFLSEVPDQLIDWRRTAAAVTSWRNTSATATNQEWRNRVGYGAKPRAGGGGSSPSGSAQPRAREIPSLVAGDRVVHTAFGMGKVLATSGEGDKAMADVDFGSSGLKRLALRYAPLEKI
jgi:DNA helicase-2/ATP-dependent DNA helicase PcrA